MWEEKGSGFCGMVWQKGGLIMGSQDIYTVHVEICILNLSQQLFSWRVWPWGGDNYQEKSCWVHLRVHQGLCYKLRVHQGRCYKLHPHIKPPCWFKHILLQKKRLGSRLAYMNCSCEAYEISHRNCLLLQIWEWQNDYMFTDLMLICLWVCIFQKKTFNWMWSWQTMMSVQH